MLSQILRTFRDSGGAISLEELRRRLGVDRSALDGMLDTLVRQGRLREVSGECPGGRHGGGGCRGCALCHPGSTIGKSYKLVSPVLRDENAV